MGQNVIELNGKRYDALTGALLGSGHAPQPTHGRAIDGFIRPSGQGPKPVHGAKMLTAPPKSKPPAPKPAATKPAHHPAKPAAPKKTPIATLKPLPAHKPEHAKTLMRRAVHKPQANLKPAIKLQTPAEIMAKPQAALTKHSAHQVDQSRLERATHVNQHQAIQRFRPTHPARPTLPVVTRSVAHVPVIAVRPAPPATERATPSHKHPQTDILETAMARATSHEQPPHHPAPHRNHRRLVNTLAIIGTFLVIGGFIGYLNLTTLELRVASMQVGFHASMPTYAPTGYTLESGVERNGGTISLSFKSGDSRYTITQQASEWNSQTLLDNTLALSDPHKVVQKNGQTIYVYGNGANAAWVTGGIRYDLTGNAQLSTDEITNIATSM